MYVYRLGIAGSGSVGVAVSVLAHTERANTQHFIILLYPSDLRSLDKLDGDSSMGLKLQKDISTLVGVELQHLLQMVHKAVQVQDV